MSHPGFVSHATNILTRSHGGPVSAVVIVEAAYVVLPRVGTSLNLDDHQFLVGLVRETVLCALGDVNAVPGPGNPCITINRARRDTKHYDPVFGAMFMCLVREATARVHMDPLHLVAAVHVNDVPGSPGPLFVVVQHAIPRLQMSGWTKYLAKRTHCYAAS